jgi:carbon monoxide dehydrogenase subunit G
VALRIEERFAVRAPVDRVWNFLVDPRRVVECVPGGALVAIVDDRTYDGEVRVSVGPLTFAYGGRVSLAEADAAARRVTIVGEAHERAGTGSALLTLASELAALPGGTDVAAHVRVAVGGRLVELGRGFLEELGHVVFREFAERVCASIERGGRRPPGQATLRALPLVLRALRGWLAPGRRGPGAQRRRARDMEPHPGGMRPARQA